MKFKNAEVDLCGGTLKNTVVATVTGNGAYIRQIRCSAANILEVWSGTAWVTPGVASLPAYYGKFQVGGTQLLPVITNETMTFVAGTGMNIVPVNSATAGLDTITYSVNPSLVRFLPQQTLYVSPAWNDNTIITNSTVHVNSVSDALAIAAGDRSVRWCIHVERGTYSESFTIPDYVDVYCEDGVVFGDSTITMVQGSSLRGMAMVSIGNSSLVKVIGTYVGDTTVTIIECTNVLVETTGVPLQIRCLRLDALIASNCNDVPTVATSKYNSAFDIEVDCLELGSVITTGVPFSQIGDGTYLGSPVVQADHTYCMCSWNNDTAKCINPDEKPCLMTWVNVDNATAVNSRILIRTNKRLAHSQFLIAIGKVSVMGQFTEYMSAGEPLNYVTSNTITDSDIPRTTLRITGFREAVDSTSTTYQVANEGTLIIENSTIVNSQGNGIYQSIDGTNYTCRTSLRNSIVSGLVRDIISNSGDRLSIIASYGKTGQTGSSIVLGTWNTTTEGWI